MEESEFVKQLLQQHLRFTQSSVSERILSDWAAQKRKFIKVLPDDYKRVLEHAAEVEARARALSQVQAGEA